MKPWEKRGFSDEIDHLPQKNAKTTFFRPAGILDALAGPADLKNWPKTCKMCTGKWLRAFGHFGAGWGTRLCRLDRL